MFIRSILIATCSLALLFGRTATAQVTPDINGIVYVKAGATGTTGDSWEDAIPELADALKAAKEQNDLTPGTIKEIWMAKGTYKPLYRADNLDGSNPQDRDNAFVLVSDVKLYGGFDPDIGVEDLSHVRILAGAHNANPENATVLSGDIDNDGTLTGNAYHIVISAGAVGDALLDGVVITGGHGGDTGSIVVNGNNVSRNFGAGIYILASSPKLANVNVNSNKIVSASTTPGNGGGIFSSGLSFPELNNVGIINNEISTVSGAAYGAGIFFTGNGTADSPKLNNVVILNNTAISSSGVAYGAGVYIAGSSPILTAVKIEKNSAQAGTNAYGGGVFQNNSSSPQFVNVLIVNNLAVGSGNSQGGGLYTGTNATGYPTLINTTVSNNTASTSPEWHAIGYSRLYNSIVYGNGVSAVPTTTIVNNSLIQGRNVNTDGNISANTAGLSLDAIFNAPTNGDYTLRSDNNPLINAGNNGLFPDLDADTKDLANNPRVYGTSIDIGAYEFNVFNIESITDLAAVSVDYGTAWGDIADLPTEVEVELNNGSTVNVSLSTFADWTLTSSPSGSGGNYDGNTAGDYVYSAPLMASGFTNTGNLVATVTVRVEKGTLDVGMEDADVAFDETAHSISVTFVGGQPDGVNVSYTINANGDPAVSGNSATVVGVYEIVATIDGGNNYENRTLTATLTIAPFSWDNVLLDDNTFTYDGTEKSLSVSGPLPSSAVVTYIYSTGGNVINAAQVIDAGIYNVQADIVGGADYGNHTLNATLTINKATFADSDVAFEDAVHDYDGTPKSISLTFVDGQPAGVSVDYTLSANSNPAVSGNSATDVGVYIITANINGGNNYNDRALTAALTIQLTQRTITLAALPEKAYGDEDFLLEATASTGEPVLFSSSNLSVATVEGNMVRIVGVGETVISATVAENPNYGNTPIVERMLKVWKAAQQIDFVAPEKVSRDIGRIPLSVSANSGLPVTLELEDASRATLEGTDLYVQGSLGAIRVTATQPGDENFEVATPVTVVIRVVDESIENFVRLHPAVSPNGDGINDFLIIDRIQDYPENKLLIHDSEGRIVYEAEGYDNAQTVFTGDGLTDGTYFYRLEITINGQRKQAKGFIQLKRN